LKHEIPDNSNRSPSPFSPFAFAVIADPHLETPDQRGVEKMRQVIDKINQQADIAFVLVLGDLIWHQPLSELKALLANLQVPSHLVLGNHDAPMIADYGHEFGSVYYTFEYAGCLFVGLWNAVPALSEPRSHEGDLDDAQITWMERTLRNATRRQPSYRHTFLFMHVPPNHDGVEDRSLRMRSPTTELLYRWCKQFSVTACFFGHIHREESFSLADTQFITTASLNWNFPDAGTSNEDQDFGGYRTVRVHERSITHEFKLTHEFGRDC
tara:strand:+ start:1505 stop:2308 length:804 start_codon:yes stop_codon:yes gene_type:complete